MKGVCKWLWPVMLISLAGAIAADTPAGPARDAGDFVETDKLVASDISDLDLFGSAVDVLGDTAIVGSQGAEAAYIFSFDPFTEQWVEEATLTPDDGHDGDLFGISVSLGIGGNVALVGAMHADVNGTAEQGAAYLFFRNVRATSGGAWIQLEKLTVNGVSGDRFGTSVSLPRDSIDIALVGAPGQTVSGDAERGAAYIFELVDGEFELATMIQAADGQSGDRFGFSTALSDDPANINGYAIIGAHFAEVAGDNQRGAAYVFHRDPSTGFWSEDAKLFDTSGEAGDRFGISVALNGNGAIAAIGANGVDAGDTSGAVIVYEEDISGWGQRQKLTGADGLGNVRSLSINSPGNTIVAGADGETIEGDTNRGAAMVYRADPGDGWDGTVTTFQLTASDGQPGDRFGSTTAMAEEVVLVGANFANGNGINQGAAYLFEEVIDGIFEDRFEES